MVSGRCQNRMVSGWCLIVTGRFQYVSEGVRKVSDGSGTSEMCMKVSDGIKQMSGKYKLGLVCCQVVSGM